MSILNTHPGVRKRLIDCLLRIRLFQTVEGHDTLIGYLPEYIIPHLRHSSSTRSNIEDIVGTCDQWEPADGSEHPLHALISSAIDFVVGHQVGTELERLRTELFPPTEPLHSPPCPYPGAVAFTRQESFYGRDAEIQDLLHQIQEHQFLLVMGSSGSGKTSLVQAGLLPKLKRPVVVLRPGDDPDYPLDLLERKLKRLQKQGVLFIDQLEELFRLRPNRSEYEEFFDRLKPLREQPGCEIVLAMNADTFPQVRESGLWDLVEDNWVYIEPLHGDQLREAIERPAHEHGIAIDPGLVELLITDIADQPGSLPLLQLTLRVLWEKMDAHGLRLDHYKQGGTGAQQRLAAVVRQVGDDALDKLNSSQRVMADWLLTRLPKSVETGATVQFFRLPRPITELLGEQDSPADLNRSRLMEVVRILRDARLLATGYDAEATDIWVDLAHDALLSSWPELVDLLNTRRRVEQSRSGWERRAERWLGHGFPIEDLLGQAELPNAEEWLHSRGKALDYTVRLWLWIVASRNTSLPSQVAQNPEER